MPPFLFLEHQWINIDKIMAVEILDDPKSGEPVCVVKYSQGSNEAAPQTDKI